MSHNEKIRQLMRSPSAMAKYQMTGKLPSGVAPQSPLIELFKLLGPGRLERIQGVTIDHRLGYEGSRFFGSAYQAMRWVHPAPEVFGTFPAESWRIKSFSSKLYLDDLLACASNYPSTLIDECPHLMRPTQQRQEAKRPRP